MIPVTNLRPGVTFEEDGDIFEVLTYNNVHLRKTSSVVKVKVKSLKRGMTIEKSFGSNAQVSPVSLYKKDFQFLYKDKDFGYFMNPESFEQINIPLIKLTGYMFLREGEMTSVRFHGNDPLSILISPKVRLKIRDTNPGVKGNSATNVYKDAVLETGLKTKVPLFVNIGDEIVVDTRDGSYTSRV